MEYKNPEFNKDDFDDFDNNIYEESPYETPQFQTTLDIRNESLTTLTGIEKETEEQKILNSMIKEFYKRNNETARFNNTDLFIKNDVNGKPVLIVRDGGKEYSLSYYSLGKVKFYSFTTLQQKYGTDFIRRVLRVDNYEPLSTQLKKGREKFERELKLKEVLGDIPLQDISSSKEGTDFINSVNEAETFLNEMAETSFSDNTLVKSTFSENNSTQTDMTKREMDSVLKAMTTVKEEVANELAKLGAVDNRIAYEREKLTQVGDDEENKKRIESRIRDLESERSARLEVINVNKEKLRSQINRIKETIRKILLEDNTLGEKLRTLFREQGITIVSIITALGMVIGFIVESIIPTSGAGASNTPTPDPTPTPTPPSDSWIKRQLLNLGKLLANLAGKVASALPGIIGAILSWLLSTTGEVVKWFGENLWALLLLVIGLIFTAAKEYIDKRK
jgi:hypothetical protein